MPDGAVIPVDRTAVPVEWDEVKTQLMRLATDLGPNSTSLDTSRSHDSSTAPPTHWAATATSCARRCRNCRGWAHPRRRKRQHRGHHQEFADLRHRAEHERTPDRAFENRLATLTSAVDDSKSDLDAALKNLVDRSRGGAALHQG